MDLENTQTAERALDCYAGGILGGGLLPSTAGSAVANDDHDPIATLDAYGVLLAVPCSVTHSPWLLT